MNFVAVSVPAKPKTPGSIGSAKDGFTRDFGRGRYENLSGAISWFTFFAG
jgi:hypothetical protein